MSDEKLNHKDYSKHSPRVLNRLIKLRMKQIEREQLNEWDGKKSLGQLRYELDNMVNTLMERSMTKGSEIKEESP